jgi:tetratricopeptide (TPR) repeat protein
MVLLRGIEVSRAGAVAADTGHSVARMPDAADEALRRATAALHARHEHPDEARAAARSVLDGSEVSDEARQVALWALGLAERELSELDAAEGHLRDALGVAEVRGDEPGAARITSALVAVVAARGRPDEALALAASIDAQLDGAERADLEMKRALVLEQLGRLADAIVAYDRALRDITRGADRVLEARARANRSIVLAMQGRIAEALADAAAAERLATAAGQWFLAGGAAHNHGYTAGLQGDVVSALDSFARAEALYARVGTPGRSAGVLASDRCEVMLAAGLATEARQQAARAVAALDAVGDVSDLAAARLLLAKACLACGDADAARAEAAAAQEAFLLAGREGWSIAAEFVGYCALAGSSQAALMVDRASRVANDLDRLGWTSEATIARVTAADEAITLGRSDIGRSLLVAASSARHRGRADHRAAAWLATARLRLVDGDRRGAARAVLAGLRILEQHRATIGATDLRVGVAAHTRGLATSGLQIALDRGRPADVLVWAERVRAHALAIPAVRPPDDASLAAALTELRRLRVALEDDRRAGVLDESLLSSLRRQEDTVRDLARIAAGTRSTTGSLSVSELRAALGPDRRLVEFVDVGGELVAVVVGGRTDRLHRLGPIAPVVALVESVSISLERLARDGISEASSDVAWTSLNEATRRLVELLIGPLGLADEEVVVVPTGALHGFPWGVVEAWADRPVTVATSARRWLAATAPDPIGDSVGVITGPGLTHAAREAAIIEANRPTATVLIDAPVDTALRMLEDVATAHLSCHGNFRSDSPMFSSLQLADGPLTVYDIEALTTPPELVVLPACNAGRSSVSVGDEVIGTGAALLGAGVRTVIAPVTSVNDTATVSVMERLHRELAAGSSPAEALSRTRAALAGDSPVVRAAAASFVCLA